MLKIIITGTKYSPEVRTNVEIIKCQNMIYERKGSSAKCFFKEQKAKCVTQQQLYASSSQTPSACICE